MRPAVWLLLVGVCGACANRPARSPFTQSELDHALAPARSLRERCYVPSAAARSAKRAVLEFSLQIEATGSARAVPTFASPEQPALVECARRLLDELRFPERGRDRLQLRFELRPSPAASRAQLAPFGPV